MKNRHLYSDDWEDTIRPAILKRDHFKCTRCGVKHRSVGYYNSCGTFIEADDFMRAWAIKQGFKVVKIHLQVMHMDQNPSNNDFINLAAACPKCHLKHDHAFNRIKRLFPRETPPDYPLGSS